MTHSIYQKDELFKWQIKVFKHFIFLKMENISFITTIWCLFNWIAFRLVSTEIKNMKKSSYFNNLIYIYICWNITLKWENLSTYLYVFQIFSIDES